MKPGIRALLPALLLVATACVGRRELMPTPRLYADSDKNPFAEVPPELRTSEITVLYVTDRTRDDDGTGSPQYGTGRSRSAAYGTCRLRLGDDLTWDQLVAVSRDGSRAKPEYITLVDVREAGRWPETPYPLEIQDGTIVLAPSIIDDRNRAMKAFQDLLRERLKVSPRKEAVLFVHGYNNTFEDPAAVVGQVAHFLGREFVPIFFSWPAGASGLLRGYTQDRESGEFSIFHFKELLRTLATCEGLERVHLIAHSRGTDVATTALRELHLEMGRKVNERDPKLATLILAAPDLDAQVITQRLGAEGLVHAPGRTVVYVSSNDRALGVAAWLFRSVMRVGGMRTDEVEPAVVEKMKRLPKLQVIDAQVSGFGSYGHDYFYSHPAVSSDLILLLRGGFHPGPDRPLELHRGAFWILRNDYLKKP
jgi:esterase/lipase superfamily enzyme